MPVGKDQNATPSHRAIFVPDAPNFGHTAFARIAPLNAIDMLVTDAPPPADVSQALKAANVELILTPA